MKYVWIPCRWVELDFIQRGHYGMPLVIEPRMNYRHCVEIIRRRPRTWSRPPPEESRDQTPVRGTRCPRHHTTSWGRTVIITALAGGGEEFHIGSY